eukprot:EG_transcript_28072
MADDALKAAPWDGASSSPASTLRRFSSVTEVLDGLREQASPERYLPRTFALEDPEENARWQGSASERLGEPAADFPSLWAYQRAESHWRAKYLRVQFPFLYLFPGDRPGTVAERCVYLRGAAISAQELFGRPYLWLRHVLPIAPQATVGEVLALSFDSNSLLRSFLEDVDLLLDPPPLLLAPGLDLSPAELDPFLSTLEPWLAPSKAGD